MYPTKVYYKQLNDSSLTYDEYKALHESKMLSKKDFMNLDSEELEFLALREGVNNYEKYVDRYQAKTESSYEVYLKSNCQTMLVEVQTQDDFKAFLLECSMNNHTLLMSEETKRQLLSKTIYDNSEKSFLKFFYKKK